LEAGLVGAALAFTPPPKQKQNKKALAFTSCVSYDPLASFVPFDQAIQAGTQQCEAGRLHEPN
jgi:hypothetical protein